MATATCHEEKHWKKGKARRKQSEGKIKSNCCFHSSNKYNGIEALLGLRSGFLCLIIKISLVNNFRQWSDLAKIIGLLKQTM